MKIEKTVLNIFVLAAALSLSGNAAAQEVVETPAAVEEAALSETPKTETKLESIVINDDQDLKIRSIFRGERIEQTQAEDIKEALKGSTDVLVGGGQRTAQKIFIRGVEDTQLNVTVDGGRQSSNMFYHQGRLSIDTELMKKIEVDAGTGDALSGPGALGGAVRFETKDASDMLLPGQKYGALVKAKYNTNADEKGLGLGFFGQPMEQLGFLLYGNIADAGNYHKGGGDAIPHTAAEPKSLLGKITYTPNESHRLVLTANTRDDNAVRTARNHMGESAGNAASDQEFGSKSYSIQHSYNPMSKLVNLKTDLYFTETAMSQTSGFKTEATGTAYGAQISNKFILADNFNLTVGSDYSHDKSWGLRDNDNNSNEEEGEVLGVFAQAYYRPLSKLTLGAGLRYDNYNFTDLADEEFNHNHISPNLKVGYQFTDIWSGYASWSQAFKGATPMDAYILARAQVFTPTVNLKGSVASTAEVGTSLQLGRTVNTISVYDTVIEDSIQSSVARTGGVMTRANAESDIKLKGINFNSNIELDVVSLRVGYAHNKAEFGNAPLGYAKNKMGSAFGDRFLFGADYKVPAYNMVFTWDTLVAAKLTDVPTGAIEQPGYDVHDVSMSWMPNEHARVGVAVNNIFDKEYVAHGTPYGPESTMIPLAEPGRDFRFMVSYLF